MQIEGTARKSDPRNEPDIYYNTIVSPDLTIARFSDRGFTFLASHPIVLIAARRDRRDLSHLPRTK